MFNKEKVKKTLECDDEFLDMIIAKFKTELSNTEKQIKEFIDENEKDKIKSIAHKLLSSTRILELSEISEVLKNIEIMCENDEDWEKIINSCEEFYQLKAAVLKEIN